MKGAWSIGSMRDWLTAKRRSCLGIFVRTDSVSMAVTEWSERGSQQLAWYEEVARIAGEEDGDFWERAVIKGLQAVHEDTVCYLVLEGQEVFYYEKDFSALAYGELAQGVKLDFAAASGWHSSYIIGYERQEEAGVFRVGGIRKESWKEKTAFWAQHFSLEGCVLFCQSDTGHIKIASELLPMGESGSPGLLGAVYGAVAGLGQKGVRFLRGKPFLYRWNWLRCSAALWGISLLLCGVAGLWLGGELYGQEQESRYCRERLSLLSDIGERNKSIEEDRKTIERKNRMLEKIHESGLRGQGLMVNAGKIMSEGIWLTGISAEAGQRMVLSGKATGYGQVSRLMEELQKDEEFFQGRIYLASADTGNDGLISFQLNGKL